MKHSWSNRENAQQRHQHGQCKAVILRRQPMDDVREEEKRKLKLAAASCDRSDSWCQ